MKGLLLRRVLGYVHILSMLARAIFFFFPTGAWPQQDEEERQQGKARQGKATRRHLILPRTDEVRSETFEYY